MAHSSEAGLLAQIVAILSAPGGELAAAVSRAAKTYVDHSGVVIWDEENLDQTRGVDGDPGRVGPMDAVVLDSLARRLSRSAWVREDVSTADGSRPVVAAKAATGAVMVITDPGPGDDEAVLLVWEIAALGAIGPASQSSPKFLRASRAASSIRAEAVAELSDHHSTTLESLLAVLRSNSLDDRAARQAATNLAAEAAVHLRTSADRLLTSTEEPVVRAFERLRDDLRPLVRYRDVAVQFVEPPLEGRALPSEVAHGARAVVRGVILMLVDQPGLMRVRVQWDCDGANLLINVRDDGPGGLSADSLRLQAVRQRVAALNGHLALAATEGWGSEMSVVLPLDPPPTHNDEPGWDLRPREVEVLDQLVSGHRNREIAARLGISENTVKFHISKIFRKLDVSSRAEAAALVLQQYSASSR